MVDDATMLSIKKFSEFTELHESTLRYYDKIGLLSPAIRGENRYRYYAPFQIITASFIKTLTSLGIQLSTIKELNRERTPQIVLALLAQQQNMLNTRLRELQTAYSVIHTYHNNIQTGLAAHEHDVCVQEFGEIRIILGSVNDFKAHDTFYAPFINFCTQAPEKKINLHYPVGAYHESMDVFLNAPGEPDRFFSQDPAGDSKRAGGQYLVAYHRGYYGEFGDMPQRMSAYARANGLAFYGPVYVTFVLDEVSVVRHDQYLSQAAVKVTKAR